MVALLDSNLKCGFSFFNCQVVMVCCIILIKDTEEEAEKEIKRGRQRQRTPRWAEEPRASLLHLCMICRLSVGPFMKHLATLHRGIWWLPWPYTNTHVTICPHCHSNELGQHSLYPPFSKRYQYKPHVEGPGSRGWLTTKWPLTHREAQADTHTHTHAYIRTHPAASLCSSSSSPPEPP